MTIKTAWESAKGYKDLDAYGAHCLLDLRERMERHEERTTRGFEAAARSAVDADKEIAELRTRLDTAGTGWDRMDHVVTEMAERLTRTETVGELTERIEDLEHWYEVLEERLLGPMQAQIAALEKRQTSHEDWHIEDIVTVPPEQPMTCETCSSYYTDETGGWCSAICDRPDQTHQNCKWTPKPAIDAAAEYDHECLSARSLAEQLEVTEVEQLHTGTMRYTYECEHCGRKWESEIWGDPCGCEGDRVPKQMAEPDKTTVPVSAVRRPGPIPADPEDIACAVAAVKAEDEEDREAIVQGLVDEYAKKWFPFGAETWRALTEVYQDELRRDPRYPHSFTGPDATCWPGDWVEIEQNVVKTHQAIQWPEARGLTSWWTFIRWLARGDSTEAKT